MSTHVYRAVERKSLKVSEETHRRLAERKRIDRETYDSVIARLLDATEDGEG